MSSAQYPKPSTNWYESRKLQSTPAGDRSFIPGERSSARNASGRKNFAEHLPKGTIDSGPEGSQPMEVTKLQRSTHKSGTGTSVKADSESETAHVSSRKSADRKTAAQYGGVVKRTVERERQATQSESDKILQSDRATSSASPGGKVSDELDDSHTGRSPQTQVQSLVSAGSHSFPDLHHVHPGEGASSFDVQTDDPMTRQNILAQAASERTEGLVILQRPSTPEHTEIQDMEMASPISEPPSDIDLQPIPEYVLMDRKATLDETRDRTATEVAHAEEINDVSNLRQGPSQADEEDVPNRTRPRRSVKPPRRYGDLIEMPSQEDIEGDVIVVSRKRLSERRIEQGTTENSATSAQDHNSHAGPSRGPSIGRSRKRKLSSNDGSDGSPSFPKRSKNPEDSYSGAKPLADVVTLRVTPTKLRSAISKQRKRRPAAKSCHPVAQEITSPGPAALPTPEHTPGSSRTPTTPELTPVSSESPPRELEAQSPSAELLQLSRKLTAREPISAKARPLGNPEVWAESRQALCETVPYFKSPQSGCYQNSGHVYAFLYDGVGNSREYMDTDVIIARAGGGMQADATGKLLQSKHHSIDDAQVQAVLNDIEHQNPIVVICGNKHSGALCQMPHRYCVLGWYKPVGVWEEKTMGKGKKAWVTVKYRLERLQSDKRAWYAPSQEMITEADREIAGGLTKKTCRDCQTAFPQVYLHGWMCLNSACDRFWKLCCGTDAPCGDLAFHPAFLLDRSRWQNEQEPFSVRPPIPDSGKVMGDNLTNINTRGVVCPHCGRCNPRRLWRGWSCDNPRCDFSNFPKHVTVKPAMLHQPWDSTGEGPTLSRNRYAKHLGVKVAVDHKLGFKVFTYTFDGIHGKLVHAVSNAKINSAPGGPDDMFDAMQKQDDPEMNLHLERRPFIGTGSSASLKLQTAARGGIIKGSPEGGKTQTRADAGEIEDAVVESMLNGAQGLFGETQQGAEDEADEADEVDGADEAEEATRPRKRPGQPSTTTTTTRTTTTTTAPTEPGDLMTAFSVNYGMPYKFIAGGSSLPFSSAPWPVRACRADLNWASQNLCSASGHSDFNEQLIFAYMEGQKVEYHDDGERGLGARIASLSLGGKAKMMLRMKSKHFVGCSKSGILTRERPVPGSVGGRETYVRRVAAWEEIQALLSCGDQGGYEARRRELAHELGLYGKRMKKAEDLVTLTLNHGDIVLMEGYEIQSYLEHKVVPEGCLRFALTCRTVLPEHLRAEERPSYGVEEDEPWMGSLGRLAEAEGKERGDGNEVMEDESGEAEGGMEWRMA